MVKPIQEQRTARVTVRFTETEQLFLVSEGDVCGLSLSSLVRSRCLGKRVCAKADLRILSELRRLGGLLKHLHNESQGLYSELTSGCLREIAVYTRSLCAELDKKRGAEDSR